MPNPKLLKDCQDKSFDNPKENLREFYNELKRISYDENSRISEEKLNKMFSFGSFDDIAEKHHKDEMLQAVLFDKDDRVEVFNLCTQQMDADRPKNTKEQLLSMSKGIAGIIYTECLCYEPGPNCYKLKYDVLTTKERFEKKGVKLVDKSSFLFQPSLFEGTAFLVGEDLLLTAKHILDKLELNEGDPLHHVSFVFDCKYDEYHNVNSKAFLSYNVYQGDRVLETSNKGDWGLIKIKKKVSEYQKILPIHFDFEFEDDLKISAIGHPLGLPMKFTGNAKVKCIDYPFIRASIDTFWGSSGSPVMALKDDKYGVVAITSHTSGRFVRDLTTCDGYHASQLYSSKDEDKLYMSCQIINEDIKKSINKSKNDQTMRQVSNSAENSDEVNVIRNAPEVLNMLKDNKPIVHCLKKSDKSYEIKALVKIPAEKKHEEEFIVKYKDNRIRFIDIHISKDENNPEPYLISVKFTFKESTHTKGVVPAVGVRTIKGNPDITDNILGHTWAREYEAI